ncbi:MAG TPA: hypothetical protein VJA25_01385 [Dehalococcoidia bacterium]|nr:hypothetical protein [Dehalococcoidia bacterium]
MGFPQPRLSRRYWIKPATVHKGRLRRQLDFPPGENIPAWLLRDISVAPIGARLSYFVGPGDRRVVTVTPKLKRQASLARTLRTF